MTTLADLREGRCDGARELTLREGLERFPEEILTLADTIEVLDLSGNRLSELPDGFARLHRLKILFLSGNAFRRLPDVLGRLPALEMVGFKSNLLEDVPETSLPENLRWLILTDNRLRRLPGSLARRPRLQKLMLAGNRLESLPDLSRCERLELVRLAANRLPGLPDGLLELPRLAWLAFAGNAFCAPRSSDAPRVSWSRIELHEKLGEGASGTIHRGVLAKTDSVCHPVAIKLFKGAVTSDGYPADEREAALAAGSHPHMVPVLGRLDDHPEGRDGLVLELVPAGYRNLGLPPSYETCTRDVFSAGTRFPKPFADGVVAAARSLLDHLHARDLSHGDLYAHNILVDDSGHALLGDFGAASFLSDLPARQRHAMIDIEHRALECLREDLVVRAGNATEPE